MPKRGSVVGPKYAAPLAREAANADQIFRRGRVKCLVALAFNAARFIPAAIKEELHREGRWQDVTQHLYLIAISFGKKKQKRGFNTDKKSDYKVYVRYVWHELYVFFRQNLPNYKRRRLLSYFDPEKFENALDEKRGALHYVREKDLQLQIDP